MTTKKSHIHIRKINALLKHNKNELLKHCMCVVTVDVVVDILIMLSWYNTHNTLMEFIWEGVIVMEITNQPTTLLIVEK